MPKSVLPTGYQFPWQWLKMPSRDVVQHKWVAEISYLPVHSAISVIRDVSQHWIKTGHFEDTENVVVIDEPLKI